MVAIDLGSNTIRFIEFDGERWGKSFEKIVRTAEGLYETGVIGEKAINRIIDAINEAGTQIDLSEQSIAGYTTAAMRLANNSTAVLQRIKEETGISFAIIDAQKEAALTLNAVHIRLSKLGITPSSFILADIGGGSTELIRYENGAVQSESINMGIVTLSESSIGSNLLEEKISQFKCKVSESLSTKIAETLVLTAGTPTTIAAYLNGMDYQNYDPDKINGTLLRLEDCFRVYDELLAMDEVTRTRYVGVGRENLIMAGILMVTAIYEASGHEEALIIDDGLREGIALEYFKLH
ncbi:Ppx/GppA phosphatase [Sulfuricurvum kujiense DSM 16994]|uniref:Ppx/GppA phosphatase n=1 Tax=Sulfuricurvum kujiense (strain ATCC BAA-921 / DSM 16994 / JCM 11577 / YK-1) TaxID=709032 RepID=E4TZ84_SULKY|nr:ppx/gppa phosphatase [Sulfuricurvum kujiense]ADR34099.1 Ppx/GppA phosphatase [Sulfuricurvum kujiense DSM 16994]